MKRTKLPCPECGKEISKSNLRKHIKAHLDEKPLKYYQVVSDNLECMFCGKLCKNKNSAVNHQRTCRFNKDRLPIPVQLDWSPKSLKVGQDIASDNYPKLCPHCGKYFASKAIGPHIRCCSYLHNEVRYARTGDTVLDITVDELAEYRDSHPTCEICGKSVHEVTKYSGKSAVKNLCIDHDHNTNKFRGLLCQACNRQLGWYEKYRTSINNYLDKDAEM